MDRAIEVWGGRGTRYHRTLWMGVLYAITIVVVLAVVTKLY